MPLSIDVEFLLGRFEASDGHDGTPPEWPPAPARLFSALVAGCEAEHAEALQWLERQGPPAVYAGETVLAAPHPKWLVTNKLERVGGSARHPARTNVRRARSRRWLARDRVIYRWTDAMPDERIVSALEDAAQRIPYLGRPTSPVIAWVDAEPGRIPDSLQRWDPEQASTMAGQRLRVPYPGFLEDLRASFAAARHVDPPIREHYAVATHEGLSTPARAHHPSPWHHVVTMPLLSRAHIPGERALEVTHALREAIIDRIGESVAPLILGRGIEAPHVGYWALPFTGHERADGHLLAVAVAVPQADDSTIRQLRDALIMDDGQWGIRLDNVQGFRALRFRAESTTEGPARWGARVERWLGMVSQRQVHPTRLWRTVLPAVLDRAPSSRIDEQEAALLSVTNAGFPEPAAVYVRREPFRHGDLHLRPSHTLRRRGDRVRPFRHLAIRFHEPVLGPVAIGALRHFGLGLCAPESDPTEVTDGQ